jgi:catechol 2,3-dioxygenase
MTTTTVPPSWPQVAFGPRRIGHVNMYVSNLEASFAFYRDVCGLQLVFDEVGLFAKFLSNGNSHHDVALMEASDKTLVGRDGQVQKSSERGTRAGLNHIAFEMATEALLVAGIERAAATGLPVESTYDHQISRSIYLPEPDGVSLELYADSTADWRELYQTLGVELLSARWQPGEEVPSEEHRYVHQLDHRPVESAIARPLRTARAALVVSSLEGSVSFYEKVIGLGTLESDFGDGRWAIMHGELGLPDLLLFESSEDEVGFHHFSLELEDMEELQATQMRAAAAGIEIVRTVQHDLKQGIVVRDPDGVLVEFYAAATGPEVAGLCYAAVATPEVREFLA